MGPESKAVEQDTLKLPLLQALVDDLDAQVHGSTLEPLSECPVTSGKGFHHDGLQKRRLAEVTFHFNPPHDGCYLVEEMHPKLDQCRASEDTKVNINYCKGLHVFGTVNQTANGGEWTFITA